MVQGALTGQEAITGQGGLTGQGVLGTSNLFWGQGPQKVPLGPYSQGPFLSLFEFFFQDN